MISFRDRPAVLPRFVEWDRAVDAGQEVAFYGWVPRRDYKVRDFVLVCFSKATGAVTYWATSSAKHSLIFARLFGGAEHHVPCISLEEGFSALGRTPQWDREVVLSQEEVAT